MQVFRRILLNILISSTTNNFLWFALTFWAYLETRSVLATSIIGGSYMALASLLGVYFGSLVDHNSKRRAMLGSNIVSLVCYSGALGVYLLIPKDGPLEIASVPFWGLVLLTLAGAIAGNIRAIAVSTLVTILVEEDSRDKANGMVGTIQGIGFAITSVFSGIAIGTIGMGWSLAIAIWLSIVTIGHLLTLRWDEPKPSQEAAEQPKRIDLRGTINVVRAVPGLAALIIFATFNNFLGGVFMALMDPYGLSLVSVEVWGFLWGFLSLAFIVGGLVVASRGIGRTPLRAVLIANVVMWSVCILFPMRSSIVMLGIGCFVYMCLIPFVEAAEQTLMQTVVPLERQGRVFGFAQAVELAATPIMSYLIGPIADYWVIPAMDGGAGARAIGSWFGSGPERGMALLFVIAGVIGLIVTLFAMRSRQYRQLSDHYAELRDRHRAEEVALA